MCTYEDLLATPDDGRRWEVLDGGLVVTPAPSPRHQWNSKNLFRVVDGHVSAKGPGEVFYAPIDVILDDTNVVEPDLIFIARKRLRLVKLDEPIRILPDLVVEIVSKGSKKRDRVTKRELYEEFGVPHYWMLDPAEEELEENVLDGGAYVRRSQLHGRARFEPAIFPGLVIPLTKIWKV